MVKCVLVGLDGRDIDLNLDEAGVDAVDRGAKSLVEHARECMPTTELVSHNRDGVFCVVTALTGTSDEEW